MAANHDPKELTRSYRRLRVEMRRAIDFLTIAVDFHVLVLNTSAWPLSGQATDLKMPIELIKTRERFEGFYDHKHTFVFRISSLYRALLTTSDV